MGDVSAYAKVVRLRRFDEIAERRLAALVMRHREDFKTRCLKRMLFCSEHAQGVRRRIWNLVWAKLCQRTGDLLGIEYTVVPAGEGLSRWVISGRGYRATALVKGDETTAETACRIIIEALDANEGAPPQPILRKPAPRAIAPLRTPATTLTQR